jgi:hypothetical protein
MYVLSMHVFMHVFMQISMHEFHALHACMHACEHSGRNVWVLVGEEEAYSPIRQLVRSSKYSTGLVVVRSTLVATRCDTI